MAAEAKAETLRDVLRRARDAGLGEGGWVYLGDRDPGLDSPCVLVDGDDLDEGGVPRPALALGLPVEGLDAPTIDDVVAGARAFRDPPDDALLLEAFLWYWRHDAFLPAPGAPPPPPPEVARRAADREFYLGLGPERTGTRCGLPDCVRGTVAHSVFCRVHHFEMIRRRRCPFED